MPNIKIKSVDLLTNTDFLNLYSVGFENKKGNANQWMVASRQSKSEMDALYLGSGCDKPSAVIIVPIHKPSNNLVLIKQFRVPLNDYIYELPAGLIDNNEEIENAVQRELKEETGLDLLEINYELSNNKLYMSPGMTNESASLIYCSCYGELSSEYLEEDEDIEAFLVSRDDALIILNEESHKIDIKAFLTLKEFVKNCI